MQIEKIKNKFLESSYHNFDAVNIELNDLYSYIQKAKKNNGKGILFSNTKKSEWLKILNPEELFLMNMHDKHILAILNISIYEAITNENYEILYNGVYTYAHLRTLNRLHLSGSEADTIIESLIYNVNFSKQNNLAEYLLKQFLEYYDFPNGKFDAALIQLLESLIKQENDVETHFNNLLKLHSRCQWLTKGWYRECNLINYMPIFLIGLYKLINRPFNIETDNKQLIDFINYLEQNKFKENKLVYTFSGKVDFLNNILDAKYDEFCKAYKTKCYSI